jgi:hypothetical protein
MHPRQKMVNPHIVLNVLHILILGPLLIGAGLRADWMPLSPTVLIALGVSIIAYHAWKLVGTPTRWINWFHALAVGPALIAAGALPAERWPREVLLMFGIAAVGYHGYYLIKAIS